MGRKASFKQNPVKAQKAKSLRHNAREAAEYLSGIPYMLKVDKDVELRKPGRGVSGESSN